MKEINNFDNLVQQILVDCTNHDLKWQGRNRKLNTAVILQLLCQQILSTSNLGVNNALINLSIAQGTSKLASGAAVSKARKKIGWAVYFDILQSCIAAFNEQNKDRFLIKGKRFFAVDSTKLTLPSTFRKKKYIVPGRHSHYPIALLSTLYQIGAEVPSDFIFARHHNERKAARHHISKLSEGDAIIFDRGFFLRHFTMNLYQKKSM
jgi:hypothetical protein